MCRRLVGKLFHRCGSVAAKLLSPKLLRVCRTASVLLEDEQRERRSCSETSWMSTVRYVGAFDACDWVMHKAGNLELRCNNCQTTVWQTKVAFLSPVHNSNNAKATFDFVEATFDFVATDGNNIERVYRKIVSFRQSRNKFNTFHLSKGRNWVRHCCRKR